MANPGKSSARFDSFGAAPRDANRQPLIGFENYFVTEDATGTPVVSPATVSNSATTTLTVPAAAVLLTVYSSVALRVSEDSTFTHYFVVPATTLVTFPCLTPDADSQLTNTGAIYLKGDAASATVQFRFDCM